MTAFQAYGPVVFQSPVQTPNDDGSTSVAMGFPVCEVNEFIEDREKIAKFIAACLSESVGRALETGS